MRVWLVCLLVGCGSAPRSGAGPSAAAGSPGPVGIRADRDPVTVRLLEGAVTLAPEPVEYVPAIEVLPYDGDDIDEQIALRERLIEAGGDSAGRVEQLVAVASLFMQKGQTNRAERAYIRAANEAGFSNYANADEVLFRAAMLLRRRGELAQARQLFYKLVKDYPTSTWISDAYIQFGDHYFDAAEYDKADKFYAKAVQMAEPRTIGYARYKLGWCHARQGDDRGALEQFLLAARNENRSAELKRASAHAFVYVYPGVGRPDRAFAALQRLDTDGAGDLYAWLGELYAARGMNDEATVVFDALSALVDAGKARGSGIAAAFSARARRELAAGRTESAEAYVARFDDAADAGEIAYYLADAAWRRAARARDMAVAAELWERTAQLFDRAADLGGLSDAQVTDAAAAAVVARHNARAAQSAGNR